MTPLHRAIARVIRFESGGNPAAVNPQSGATGLIQFTPETARQMGTTTAALRKMPAHKQMGFVRRYFGQFGNRLRTPADAYMAVLAPGAIGKPDDHVLFRRGRVAYTQNAGLDINRDGVITKGEAARRAGMIWLI